MTYTKVMLSILILLLSSCSSTIEKLRRVGKEPMMAKLYVPVDDTQPTPEHKKEIAYSHKKRTNSLWQPGSNSFFRDNRAWRVGDIVKVSVVIQDNAKFDSSTKQTRNGSDTMGITNILGKESLLEKKLRVKSLSPLISANSQRNHTGGGNTTRNESVKTEISAIVRQVLPNGNLVIEGHQEVRINFELREVKIAGIITPRDIQADNSINSEQIAEARISYGGRGVVSDVQQPRIGSQVIDIISPF